MTQFELPSLPYDLDALEPVICKEIMDLHYNKHHKAYTDNLNKALASFEEAKQQGDVEKMIALQSAIKFNGGGYLNHKIFWTNLAPQSQGGGGLPKGELLEKIEKTWGSFDNFKKIFNAKTGAIQGSGWGWLGYHKETKELVIETCQNQDPLSTKGLIPLLGVDVWEHAYYLQYKNARPKYLEAIWDIINWDNVSERYQKAKS